MLFNSTIFLFLFLPAVLAIYLPLLWLASRRSGGSMALPNTALLMFSVLFYTWTESFLVFLMLGSTLLDFACGHLLGRHPGRRSPVDRLVLACSICGNLTALAVFKYFEFGVAVVNDLLLGLGLQAATIDFAINITLPLGISFYTFQSMSYTIDIYRGRAKATHSFATLACYVSMFPQLIAGPIVRYVDVAASLHKRSVRAKQFASGVQRFVYGLGKKVLIADTLAMTADAAFAVEAVDSNALSPPIAWLGLVCYTLQIYFDFSGYSDMAIGLGRMLGFRFQENFRHPYAARSLREFWRRWHISLSSWFRDYLYIPLGGNRGSALRTGFNLTVVFLLCGLWHGASWHFVAWGALHGLVLFAERSRAGRCVERLRRPLQHVYLIGTVMVAWVLFRCTSLDHAWSYFGALVGLGSDTSSTLTQEIPIMADTVVAIIVGALLSTPLSPALARARVRTSHTGPVPCRAWSIMSIVWLAVIIGGCWMRLASSTHQPFIYFRF